MLTKLQAGASIDLITKGDIADVLKSWQNELTRGARVRRLAIQGASDGAGVLAMGSNADGPEEGMVWGITRFSVAPGPAIPAAGLAVFANDTQSSQVLISKLVTDLFPDARGCMIAGGDSLRITGTGLPASTQITVTLSMREVPAAMAWSL
jgi:hypothetical protein